MVESEIGHTHDIARYHSQTVPMQGEIYLAPNLVPPLEPDEQAVIEQLNERVGSDLVSAMKANGVFPPNLIDPDGEQK